MQELQGSIPGLGRSSGGGNGNLFQNSCLGTPVDREALWASVHGVIESDLTEVTEQAHTHLVTDRMVSFLVLVITFVFRIQ